MQSNLSRGTPKKAIGVVLKSKMNKTLVVGVSRLVKHILYKKYIMRTQKFYVHDERRLAKEGDKVEIIETRPLSKLKRWRLVEVLKK